jgi:mannose-6-phosphate isomerase-like protein (cupin superfamily)
MGQVPHATAVAAGVEWTTHQHQEDLMPKISRASAPTVNDFGVAEDRRDDVDGFTLCFTTIREDGDLAPFLKGLPGDACQCPHWGYVFSGTLTFTFGDHVEVYEPGDAFYTPAGHTPKASAGSEFIMFSPQAELEVTESHLIAAMQAAGS